MTREEQITNAARNYVGGIVFSSPSDVLHFTAGAKWADEHPANVWHGISEMPKAGLILCHALNESFEVVYIDEEITSAHWLEFILRSRVQEWLYISDLHPKEFRQ